MYSWTFVLLHVVAAILVSAVERLKALVGFVKELYNGHGDQTL
jgi:hypothetical protein